MYYSFFILYYIFLVGITYAHLVLLLYQQISVLQQFEVPTGDAILQSIPTWLPLGLMVFLALLCQPYFCRAWCKDSTPDKRKDTCQALRENWKFNTSLTM